MFQYSYISSIIQSHLNVEVSLSTSEINAKQQRFVLIRLYKGSIRLSEANHLKSFVLVKRGAERMSAIVLIL